MLPPPHPLSGEGEKVFLRQSTGTINKVVTLPLSDLVSCLWAQAVGAHLDVVQLGCVGGCSQMWGGHFAKVNNWSKGSQTMWESKGSSWCCMGPGCPDLPSVPLKGVKVVAGIENVGYGLYVVYGVCWVCIWGLCMVFYVRY